MYCNKCGRENEEDNIFCEYCGAKLAEEDDTESCYIDGEEANDESADDQEMTGTSRDSDGHDEEENTEQADTEAARENISFDEEDDDEKYENQSTEKQELIEKEQEVLEQCQSVYHDFVVIDDGNILNDDLKKYIIIDSIYKELTQDNIVIDENNIYLIESIFEQIKELSKQRKNSKEENTETQLNQNEER